MPRLLCDFGVVKGVMQGVVNVLQLLLCYLQYAQMPLTHDTHHLAMAAVHGQPFLLTRSFASKLSVHSSVTKQVTVVLEKLVQVQVSTMQPHEIVADTQFKRKLQN